MYGVEFREAENALICGMAEFEVRKRREPYRYYRIRFHPDIGMVIEEPSCDSDGDEWKIIKERAEPEDLKALLPKKSDFGKEWTYADFILAMTFWAEGHKRGHARGYYQGCHSP